MTMEFFVEGTTLMIFVVEKSVEKLTVEFSSWKNLSKNCSNEILELKKSVEKLQH
jgi:hypothetical protein